MNSCYWNTAGQRFPLPEQALEPLDARMHIPRRRGGNDEDDWYEPVCCADDEEESWMEDLELLFDLESHTYTLNGETLPSVTRLTDIYSTAAIQEGDGLELTMEAAAERGTLLHAYLEHRLWGGEQEDFELPDAYDGYADGVELFLAEHTLDPYLTETPMWGEAEGVRFAGTPDFVGMFDRTLTVLDWKFVSQVQKTKVGAQLSGYLSLCLCSGLNPEKLACVQFTPDGMYRLYPAGTQADSFYLCLKVWREKHKKHPRGAIA